MVSKFKLDSLKNEENKGAISRSFEIANNYAGELSIEVLPLDKIELDPENKRDLILTMQDVMNGINTNDPDAERKKLEWKSLESLARTIKEEQLINPIFVYRYGNYCRLIAGERRTLASAIAGKKEIIARIASQRPIGTKLKILQWVENNERSDLSLTERIASLEAIIQDYFNENNENNEKKNREKITAKLLGDLTGISQTQARRYILIINADQVIRTAIDQGKLENIKLIELICSTQNPCHQKELLNAAINGKSFDSIYRLKLSLEECNSQKHEKLRRKKNNISFSVKPNVLKIIMESLILNYQNEALINKQLKQINNAIEWSDRVSIEKAFKKMAALIEVGA